MSYRTCTIPECNKKYLARGWCRMHYERWRRTGDPEKVTVIRGDLNKLFWSKVPNTPDKGCWLWTGTLDPDGYGALSNRGSLLGAHRYSYESLVGPIPDGLVIDHLCRVRNCVNPAHMEPVTDSENTLRGEGPPAQNARKTHCHKGHEFSPDNTIIRPDGHRRCRACHRAYQRAWMQRKKAVKA